jgi:hypothetical protein
MDFINWPAIIVAALVPSVVGYLWYSLIFGKAWLASTGKSAEFYKEGNMPVIYGVSFLMAIVFAFALKVFIETTHGGHLGLPDIGSFHTLSHGLLHGAMYTAFFAVPMFLINGLFERRGQTNTWIHIGYWIVTGAVMGGILDAWV